MTTMQSAIIDRHDERIVHSWCCRVGLESPAYRPLQALRSERVGPHASRHDFSMWSPSARVVPLRLESSPLVNRPIGFSVCRRFTNLPVSSHRVIYETEVLFLVHDEGRMIERHRSLAFYNEAPPAITATMHVVLVPQRSER